MLGKEKEKNEENDTESVLEGEGVNIVDQKEEMYK
jgi:hypothetical protein